MEDLPPNVLAEKSKLLGKRISVHKRNLFRPIGIILGVMFFAVLAIVVFIPVSNPIVLISLMVGVFAIVFVIPIVLVNTLGWSFFTHKLVIFENGMVFVAPNNNKIILWEQIGSATIDILKTDKKDIGNYQFKFFNHKNRRLVSFNEWDFNNIADGPLINIMKQCFIDNQFELKIDIRVVENKRRYPFE